jgi:hypothetical protein
VTFTRLELIKMLGWPDEGRSYDRIKLSLQRIANVTYNYDNAWWDGRQKAWTDQNLPHPRHRRDQRRPARQRPGRLVPVAHRLE